MRCDRIWTNARLLTMSPALPGLGRIDRGLVACLDGRIAYAGPEAEAPAGLAALQRVDCAGRWITPGFIDCHTHLIHAGNRAGEFEQRLAGVSYEQIARAGGGILSTVRATRAANVRALVEAALPRLDAMLAEGVTTLEIKSGYGLTLEDELKQLRAARALADERAVEVVTTFLGAHAVPPDTTADAYVEQVCRDMIPAVAAAGLASAVDAFCERIAFDAAQTERIFEAAARHGLRVKLHADQLSNSGGAQLAARHRALSADHLEHTDEAGVQAMRAAGTAAVLLPGAYYFTRDTRQPPIELLRRHGVPMALATDCNPGTSPLTSPLLAMNLAATLFRLTVDECLAGVTREAARALGRSAELGSLEAGKHCDLAIWDIDQPVDLVYRMGMNALHARVWRGQ
jgi:imidazolonepropionase